MSGAAAAAIVRAALAATLAALYCRAFVVAPATIASASMEPTLAVGDRVLVDRMLYAPGLPRWLAALLPVREVATGDVVWLRSPERGDLPLVKRCVAVEGGRWRDTVLAPRTLAVEGDNRGVSHDSRAFGPVPAASVGGRVVLVVWSSGPEGTRWQRTGRPVR